MDEILREVQTYDANTLRKKLLEYGVKVGPIAPTTISLFQKRLANELCRLRGIETDDLKDKSKAVTVELDNKVYAPSGATRTVEPNEKISDVYYAVCLPGNVEPNVDSAAEQLVFSDKELALKTAKKYKGSRFKVFKSEQDAKIFSRLTAESALPSPRRPSQEDNIVQDTAPSGESSPFKAPKPQELALLRKTVESGDVDAFKRQVWNNPRFLVGSGDTPAMFQEGPRYTAMHVAAMKNKPEICQAILDILEDPVFVNKLYAESKHTEETQNSRINFLVDLYLNMPDKGNCESPLHMACKYGHADVVQVLVAHPRTDKTLRNKYGDTPKTLICSRCTAPSLSVKKQIEDLLQGQCYVPLMRYEDNAAPPVVVQPWSPDVSNTPLDVPVVSNSPRDISMSVKACAGPMSPTDAGLFHKRWTTPPSQSPELARAFFNTKRSDSEKGMERIGRQLAHELNVPWSEYWEFLDQFVDMKTPAGLDLLENYLKKRVWLKFIKDFKESQGISEQIVDYSGFTTPKTNRVIQLKVNELDQSFESDIVKDVTSGKTVCSPNSVKDNRDDKEMCSNDEVTPATCCGLISKQCGEGTSEDKDTEGEGFKGGLNDVLSPVSNLAQHFATLKLNESWSERATVNSTDKSMSDKNTDRNDNGKSTSPPAVERFLSAESESSYTTAPEDVQDLSLSFSSPSSPEVQTGRVCFKLKDVAICQTLLDVVRAHKQSNNVTGSSDIVKFVVQLKKNGDFLNIISIPEVDNVQKMVLLEDVEVETCDGDINKVLEGDVIEIGADSLEVEDDTVVLAYMIRTQKLPRAQYIYGPQPTREDLNVSRALEDVTLSPECHPNVFHWKINLSKFLRDTNYRWQSPAKIKQRIKQASPVPSPLGKSSPVIPYGSPLATRNQPTNHVTSDIRTRLFPSIQE